MPSNKNRIELIKILADLAVNRYPESIIPDLAIIKQIDHLSCPKNQKILAQEMIQII